MSIPGSASPLFFGADAAAADTGYKIDRSLRFNDDDSAYLNRTPSSAGNRRTFTWSGWVKRASFSGDQQLIYAAPSSSDTSHIRFTGTALHVFEYTTGFVWQIKTTRAFRDPGAWYHIVVAVDTTQSTASDRVKIYVNGVQETDFSSSSYPSQNADTEFNNSVAHTIGRNNGGSNNYLDGYLAEVHWIDGQQLAASDFGEYDDNNVWQPKAFGGTYGPLVDQTQNWSSYGDTNDKSAEAWEDIFDGNGIATPATPHMVAQSGQTAVWTPTTAISFTKLELYANNDGYGDITLNGSISTTGTIPSGGGGNIAWTDVTSLFSTKSLSSIEVPNSYNTDPTRLGAIRIDGKILVDSTVTLTDNSFKLDFSDNSTAAALGNDDSGNDNDFTVNNFSVASGSGNDSLIDTPTNYTAASGNNGGNYCTLNPLKNQSQTLKNGNLESNGTSGRSTGTLYVSSGKFYWEFTAGTSYTMSGIESSTSPQAASYAGENDQQYALYGNNGSGQLYHNGSISSFDGFVSGDVIGVALDMDGGNLYFYKNGSAMNSGNAAATGLTGAWTANCRSGSGAYNGDTAFNFGQRPFAHTPPTGYVSLCTANLPDPTIADGSTAFDVALWTGNGSSAQTISTPNLSPDMVWFKERSNTSSHAIIDAVRGSTNAAKVIYPDRTDAEITANSTQSITSLNSDGFTIGSSDNSVNQSNETYVGWAWDAGSSTVSNTDGSIASNVRANQTVGFSIVTATQGSGNSTWGHGLNTKPDWIVLKARDQSYGWYVSHSGLDNQSTKFLQLHNTNAVATNSNWFASTEPTSSVITTKAGGMWNSGDSFVAYCWTAVDQFSSFGSYEGNNSSDGPFVFTGMRPRWIMIKHVDSTGSWAIYDTARDDVNAATKRLFPNLSSAESDATSNSLDILSNGFKIRSTGNVFNSNNSRYIYAAFAEHPMSLNGGLAR